MGRIDTQLLRLMNGEAGVLSVLRQNSNFVSEYMERALESIERKRVVDLQRKRTIYYRQERALAKQRKQSYSSMQTHPQYKYKEKVRERESKHYEQSPNKKSRLCSICKRTGHNKKSCDLNTRDNAESPSNITDELDNEDQCYICDAPGYLICCDGCPNACHIECAGLQKEPPSDASWFCDHCN